MCVWPEDVWKMEIQFIVVLLCFQIHMWINIIGCWKAFHKIVSVECSKLDEPYRTSREPFNDSITCFVARFFWPMNIFKMVFIRCENCYAKMILHFHQRRNFQIAAIELPYTVYIQCTFNFIVFYSAAFQHHEFSRFLVDEKNTHTHETPLHPSKMNKELIKCINHCSFKYFVAILSVSWCFWHLDGNTDNNSNSNKNAERCAADAR